MKKSGKPNFRKPGTIIDVRTPDEWADGYIDRADFVNLFDQDFIAQVNKIQADKNRPLYILPLR